MDGTDVSEQTNQTAVEEPVPQGAVADVTASAVEVAEESAASTAGTGAEPEPAVTAEDSELDGASLMEQFLNDPSHDYKSLKYGDVMDGVIMHLDREEILVDIGSKSEGIVPSREYSSLSADERQALAVGDTILVFVVQPENPEGHAVVSIDRARQEKSWRRLQELHEANEVIEAEVTNYNKGGLLVNLDGVRGFVPASQVTEIRGGDEASKQADMARLIGSSLPLKVIEINRHRNRLILSERQAVQERRDVMKERLIDELSEGEVRKGRVSSICDFGAFVDIGGADGLVHLSELSWSRVRHPSEVLRVGQEVDVYVLGINAQEKKIALSIKRTQAEPWSRVAAAYEVGQLVRGTVTQLANFGAFARIEDGIEGLIHVSELVDDRVSHPKQVVSEGDDLLLRIIRIDPQRRRMGLSLRRALDTPDVELQNVFGPEALQERDELIERIRVRLEAEGIELGDAFSGEASETSSEEPAESADPASTPLAATLADVAAEPTAEEVPATAASESATRPPAQPKPRKESSKPAVDLPEDIDGELSAMAMAFAMAGAPADLVAEATGEGEADASPDGNGGGTE
ncbi:MAG: binding domain protein [Thermomicrobiales bacterium]|jgi:small subunit ribosomal protein S1|nr:binding domain protein [Thermomicrobiales bacterium]